MSITALAENLVQDYSFWPMGGHSESSTEDTKSEASMYQAYAGEEGSIW